MNEVVPQLLWLESDEWLDEQGTRGVGPSDGLPVLGTVSHVTERRAPGAGRARVELPGYARLAVLLVLVIEIAWCAYLVSLAISLL